METRFSLTVANQLPSPTFNPLKNVDASITGHHFRPK